jgi:transposase InsO family protein
MRLVPWKVSAPVDERMKFLTRLNDGERMVDLCREFEISRKTGYKFLERFKRLGIVGLLDQRRVPERIPHRTPPETVKLIVDLRREHPTWGAKKLREVLVKRHTGVHFPVPSTIGEILAREKLIVTKRRRSEAASAFPLAHLSEPVHPNDLWCIDYKGQFRLRNGRYCYPLTLTDAASRYILACEAFEQIDGHDVRRVLEDVFSTMGLPSAIRFDGGAPFASTGLARLSKLSAWWLSLGIKLEQTEPASPEQNGRHERMHRTLKAETTRPPASTLLQQQERFDVFCETFNSVRPHEGIAMRCPADVFVPSARSIATVQKPAYPLHDFSLKVSSSGHVRLPGPRSEPHYFVANSLAGHDVGVRELADNRWLVSFCGLDLGVLDRGARRFIAGPVATEVP